MQRLFSTFADGWPGGGILLQRLLIGVTLLHRGIEYLSSARDLEPMAPEIIGAGAGILLLAGLWTPMAGALVAIVEVWIVFSHDSDSCNSLILAALGASLAMIGPGAWSIDAWLFGRKHIHVPDL